LEPEIVDHLAEMLVVRLQADSESARRRRQNLGLVDRTARIVAGAASTVTGGVLLHAHLGMLLGLAISAILILLGLAGIASGARGCCPLYRRVGWSTARQRPVTTITRVG
jgi:hypothetical protein